MKIELLEIYPEEFRRNIDKEKYQAKGTCAVNLTFDQMEFAVKNITYRIDHEGKIFIKPPFRVYSHKKKGQKPKLVPSIEFKNSEVWLKIEEVIKEKLMKEIPETAEDVLQMSLFDEALSSNG